MSPTSTASLPETPAPDSQPVVATPESETPSLMQDEPAGVSTSATPSEIADLSATDSGDSGISGDSGNSGNSGDSGLGTETTAAVVVAMSPAACSAQLKQLFPALFTGVAKPLKLRIQADIQARVPGLFTKQLLSVVLRRYTGSHSYLVALTQATHRFDLDGAPAGELSAEHKQAALDELTLRRTTQRDAQREAQRKLQDAQRQERQEHQERQERQALEEQKRRNRATLLHDFENTTLTPANFSVLKGITVEAMEGYLATARQEALARRAAHGDVPREAAREAVRETDRDGTRQRPFEPRGDRPRQEGRPTQAPRAPRR